MSKYMDMNDYELVHLAQEFNEEANIILHRKYEPLITQKSRKYFKYLQNKGIELSDLIQECTIGFEESIHNFNPLDDVSFYTFTNICMDRQLMSEITKLNRNKHRFLNEALPLETLDDESCDKNLIDSIQDNSHNPEEGLLHNEEYQEVIEKIVTQLTDLEECVFKLKIQGFNNKEIGDILDKDEKSVDNAFQRIRLKIKNMRLDHE